MHVWQDLTARHSGAVIDHNSWITERATAMHRLISGMTDLLTNASLNGCAWIAWCHEEAV